MKTKFMYVVLATLLLGSPLTLLAQDKVNKDKKQPPTREQMVQMQTNRMVKSLMLDDATAAKFTPVYEKYLAELAECRTMNRGQRLNQDAKDAPKPAMTDAEIAKQIKDQFTQSRKVLDVREKYYTEFSKVLSQKQVMKIYQMERNNMNNFKKEFDRRKGQKAEQGQYRDKDNKAFVIKAPNKTRH